MGGIHGDEMCRMGDIITGSGVEDGRKTVGDEELSATDSVSQIVQKGVLSKNKEEDVVEEAVIVNKEYLAWARDRVPGKFSQYLNLC
eukprot:Nk52_evm1s1047 gene=Nk52_evmTU1s1047